MNDEVFPRIESLSRSPAAHVDQICDRFGPGRGDEILAAVGAALTSSVRISDFVGCYDKFGFVVLLPDTDSAATRPLADKIQAMISAIQIFSRSAAQLRSPSSSSMTLSRSWNSISS